MSEDIFKPQIVEEALKSKHTDKWKEAINAKYALLLKNHTWKLVLKPQDHKTIRCRWIFKVKHKADRSVKQFKAHLVMKGYTQQYKMDYNDTFSPVARYSFIYCIIAIAT